MALIRLELHEHPAPPHHEIREKTVLDSGDRIVGTVANLYVDEDNGQLRFVDVLTMSGLLDLERKHHLVPVEAVSEEDSGSITLGVDLQSVQSAPPFPNPHAVPDEEYQPQHPRALRLRLEVAQHSEKFTYQHFVSWTSAMQDFGCGLPRTRLLGTSVNRPSLRATISEVLPG